MPVAVCSLEPDNDSSPIAEIALVLVAIGKAIAEPRKHKIKLRGPDGDGFGHWNVDASTKGEIERVVAGVRGGYAT